MGRSGTPEDMDQDIENILLTADMKVRSHLKQILRKGSERSKRGGSR